MVAVRTKTEEYEIESVAEFEEWAAKQPSLVDKRFEFLDGKWIEKDGMKQEEAYIADLLIRFFVNTEAFQKGDALLPELDSYVNDKRKRIPDLTYLTKAQKIESARGKRVATLFAIELLSDNDYFLDTEKKVEDYFSAGAKLVWYISPKQQKIYAYTSPTEVKILRGEAICSAAPVIPDFSFKVKDLFAF